MHIMIIGASRGLGRAFIEGLGQPGDTLIGVSRTQPTNLRIPAATHLQWIEADLSSPQTAATLIAEQAPAILDTLVCNVGIWEAAAFTPEYDFLSDTDDTLATMISTNITATILLLKRLIPRLLLSPRPQLVLVGSTSALRQSGRPEVTFAASKFALNGIADALRESFRGQRLAVTTLQLGYLNTDDALSVPVAEANRRDDGQLIPVHDVVQTVRSLITLSGNTFVRELVMPALKDERF